MNELSIFNFEDHAIRTVMIHGAPWAVAKDVADALGYTWKGAATIGLVPPEWKGYHSIGTPSGNQEMAVLSKEGLLFFLGRSDKPAALKMQKWAWGTVIPAVLETGSYSVAPVSELDRFIATMGQIMPGVLGQVRETRLMVESTQAEVRTIEAKVESLAEAVNPEKMAAQVKDEVDERLEAWRQAEEQVADFNARTTHAVKQIVDHCVGSEPDEVADPRAWKAWDRNRKQNFAMVNRIAKKAAGNRPRNAIRDPRHAHAALSAIYDHMRGLGMTPAPLPDLVERPVQRRFGTVIDMASRNGQ